MDDIGRPSSGGTHILSQLPFLHLVDSDRRLDHRGIPYHLVLESPPSFDHHLALDVDSASDLSIWNLTDEFWFESNDGESQAFS